MWQFPRASRTAGLTQKCLVSYRGFWYNSSVISDGPLPQAGYERPCEEGGNPHE